MTRMLYNLLNLIKLDNFIIVIRLNFQYRIQLKTNLMKTIFLFIILSFHVVTISLCRDNSLCFSSSGTHCFFEIQNRDIVVKFDTILSKFNYQSVKGEIEKIGFILYNSLDTSENIMIFRQLNDSTTDQMISSIYNIDNVDTIFYPLIDSDGKVIYYDCEKVIVGFEDFATDDTIQSIIMKNNGTVVYYHSFFMRYYYLSIPRGQDPFETLQNFKKDGNVDWVDLYKIDYGGDFYFNCEVYDTLYDFSKNFKLLTNTKDTLLLIEYSMPSSPCYKVNDRFIYSNDSIDYYGIYNAGDLATTCEETDTISIKGFDPEKTVLTVHYCSVDRRCFINRQVYPVIKLETDQIADPGNVIHYSCNNDVLKIYSDEKEMEINSVAVYNLQGQLVKIFQLQKSQKQVQLDLGDIQRGLLIVKLTFPDNKIFCIKLINQ